MSVFRVKLNNTNQGQLDLQPPSAAPGLGTQFTTSKQRQAFIMGPGKTQRLLVDGETFTDCNYYKKFAYPQCSLENAILEVVTDDGSPWPNDSGVPVAEAITVVAGTDFTDAANQIDVVTTYGGTAVMTQIENQSGADGVQVMLNGSATAVFTIGAGDTQVFNNGDLAITSIAFANTVSGAADVDVQVILSVQSACET